MTIYSLEHSFPYLEPVCCFMSSSNCCFLTCIQISQEAGKVVWYSHLFKISLLAPQFSSVVQSCLTLCDLIDCSTPGSPVLHSLPHFPQTHVHWVSDAIQPSHPLSSPSPPALNLFQHQGLFKRVGSSHQVAKALELQFQHHRSFQGIFRVDFL